MAIISSPALAAALFSLLPASAWAANLLVSHYNGNLYGLTLTTSGAATPSLAVTSSVKACGQMPSWLTLDKEGGLVYCTDESGANSGSILTALTVGANGAMKVAQTSRSPGGELHSTLYGGSDGKGFIATAEYDPSSIATFKLPLGSTALQRLHFTMSGYGPVRSRQDKPHPHSTFTDPTGKFLLSADLGADLIRIFAVDAATGALTECPTAATGAGDGPRHGAWWAPKDGSADGQMLYIVNELGNSVTVWQATYPASASGCLTLKKTQSISAYGPGKSAPANSKSAEVHVAGDFVYAVNRNDRSFGPTTDSCATYSIDPATGSISFVESTSAHSYYPRTFQINRAGDMVAFAGQTSSNVAIVARNTTTGRLGDLLANVQVGTPGTAGNEDGLSAVIWDE